MPLLVARQQVESHKLLVAVAHVAAVDLLGVVCCFGTCQSALQDGNVTSVGSPTVQLMALQMLGSRVNLVAAGVVAHKASRRALPAGALVRRRDRDTVAVAVARAGARAGSRGGARGDARRRGDRNPEDIRSLWRLHPSHLFIAGPRRRSQRAIVCFC